MGAKKIEEEIEDTGTKMKVWVESLRMSHWLVIAFALIFVAIIADWITNGSLNFNKVSTLFWKAGLVTIAAHIGYWIEREANKRTLSKIDDSTKAKCRAIIIAAVVLGISWGM